MSERVETIITSYSGRKFLKIEVGNSVTYTKRIPAHLREEKEEVMTQEAATNDKETVKKRAEAHWDGYVGPMQKVILDSMIEMIQNISRFHYISSHIHGVKHAEEDIKEAAKE